jgi:hypothetical protein
MHPHPTRCNYREIDIRQDIIARFESGEEHELIALFKIYKANDVLFLRGYHS